MGKRKYEKCRNENPRRVKGSSTFSSWPMDEDSLWGHYDNDSRNIRTSQGNSKDSKSEGQMLLKNGMKQCYDTFI